MSTPFGDSIRARRDATAPATAGLAVRGRRRVPGLRRSELAALAGISVEYLIRIEQGRDRNPSVSVVNSLADALQLDLAERDHLRQVAKLTSATCLGVIAQPRLDVRPTVKALLDQLEPGIAFVTNRLGDVLAHTSGFDLLTRPTGLLDGPMPNLTTFVFTDPRARTVFPEWEQIADCQASDLQLVAPTQRSDNLIAELTEQGGAAFTARLRRHGAPPHGVQRWRHPLVGEVRLEREALELPAADAQQLVVLLPADEGATDALKRLRQLAAGPLRAVN